jgi:hypothetical protein
MPKSNIPQIKIVNVETGEEIVRDATAEEIAQMQSDVTEVLATRAEVETKAAEKQALLDRLGLTADEVKLLLG